MINYSIYKNYTDIAKYINYLPCTSNIEYDKVIDISGNKMELLLNCTIKAKEYELITSDSFFRLFISKLLDKHPDLKLIKKIIKKNNYFRDVEDVQKFFMMFNRWRDQNSKRIWGNSMFNSQIKYVISTRIMENELEENGKIHRIFQQEGKWNGKCNLDWDDNDIFDIYHYIKFIQREFTNSNVQFTVKYIPKMKHLRYVVNEVIQGKKIMCIGMFLEELSQTYKYRKETVKSYKRKQLASGRWVKDRKTKRNITYKRSVGSILRHFKKFAIHTKQGLLHYRFVVTIQEGKDINEQLCKHLVMNNFKYIPIMTHRDKQYKKVRAILYNEEIDLDNLSIYNQEYYKKNRRNIKDVENCK